MKNSTGLGKKSLYLGLAFLVVVGLLSLFVFTGARDGFYVPSSGLGSCDGGKGGKNCTQLQALSTAQISSLTTSQVSALTSDQIKMLSD